jgi:hypothetical protein
VALVALVGACSGDDGASAPTTTTPTTTTPTTTAPTTTAPTTTAPTTTAPATTAPTTTAPATTAPTTTAPTTTAPTTTAPTTTAPVCPGPAFGRAAVESTTIPPAVALLTAVRVANHDCYDRVVFEFRGPALPEWRVEASTPPFSGPSGEPVDVAGTAWLRVRFATADAHTEAGEATVGIAPIDLRDAAALAQVQLIEDFEAVVVFVVGTDGPRPFRVLTFTDPPRVAIDVLVH